MMCKMCNLPLSAEDFHRASALASALMEKLECPLRPLPVPPNPGCAHKARTKQLRVIPRADVTKMSVGLTAQCK
eukprot:6410612-Amphidinium_carterae.1